MKTVYSLNTRNLVLLTHELDELGERTWRIQPYAPRGSLVFYSKEEAINAADKCRNEKIGKLEKRISKLQAMVFE
jgi:hypothetical protein